MRFADLTRNAIEKIESYRYDRIVEKHEGPERWSSIVEYYDPEFMEIGGKPVLLPLDRKHHDNISILRSTIDQEEKTFILFLKDTTYVETPEEEYFSAGFVAICDKVPGEDFYIAILYHEWFIIDEHLAVRDLDIK